MTAVKEQFMQILSEMQRDVPRMQDSDVQQIINVYFSVKPKKSKAEEMAEFEADMDRCQEWAKDVGLTPDDITASIKAVRQRKRQNSSNRSYHGSSCLP